MLQEKKWYHYKIGIKTIKFLVWKTNDYMALCLIPTGVRTECSRKNIIYYFDNNNLTIDLPNCIKYQFDYINLRKDSICSECKPDAI